MTFFSSDELLQCWFREGGQLESFRVSLFRWMWWRDRETEAVDTNGRTFWNGINMKSKLLKDRSKESRGQGLWSHFEILWLSSEGIL